MAIIGLLVGVFLEHRRSMEEVEARFSDKQMHLARSAAEWMAEVFREVRKMMILLGHNDEVVAATPSGLKMMTLVSNQLREHGLLHACVVQQERVSCSGGEDVLRPPLRDLLPCDQPSKLCVRGPKASLLSPTGWVLLGSVRLPRTATMTNDTVGTSSAAQRGEIVVVLDWGVLKQQVKRITKFSKDTYAWVLDHKGRPIMHPEHQTSPARGTPSPSARCGECHAVPALHAAMLAGKVGAGRISVGDHGPKLVAHTPVEVGQQSWSLAVATSAKFVTAAGRRSLTRLSIFTGSIMLVMIIGAYLLDREASRRLQAADSFRKELEQKVTERATELRSLYGRLAALQAHHTRLERTAVAGEMASIVAHEIRTPLNALSINAQVLSELLLRDGSSVGPEALEVLQTLEQEIQRVNALVEENVLSVVRASPARLRPICVNDVVEESVKFMESEADHQAVRLICRLSSGLSQVNADPAKLRQVLLNLILNAIQAMPDGGEVRLTTRYTSGEVTVEIQDTGPGIDGGEAEDSDPRNIFKPFVTTKSDGTGLGLAICSRLIRAMSGSIDVHSEPGKGARFEITLPATTGDQEGDQPCL